MSRYSNQPLLLEKLQNLAVSVALETTPQKPVTEATSVPRVHKLDDRLGSETVARIVAEYEAGASSAAIGSLFSLSKKSVVKVLREAGIKVRYPRMTESELRRATMLYNDGCSLVEVGKRLGRDHSTIYKSLKRAGMRLRDTHGRS
ncbi:helix-turn-helix domain-containing protein [Kribbella sp. NPDC058693]|uniref:helix-turn-helix domain-containing protein n=1 Tax=Kribbella sp. NPDC058693 TaxID=3346602 RepID=UPI0036513099